MCRQQDIKGFSSHRKREDLEKLIWKWTLQEFVEINILCPDEPFDLAQNFGIDDVMISHPKREKLQTINLFPPHRHGSKSRTEGTPCTLVVSSIPSSSAMKEIPRWKFLKLILKVIQTHKDSFSVFRIDLNPEVISIGYIAFEDFERQILPLRELSNS